MPSVAAAVFNVTPSIDCLDPATGPNPAGQYVQAWFGYVNPNPTAVTIDYGSNNLVLQPPNFRPGQPTVFDPGVHTRTWSVTFDATAQPEITWVLQGAAVTADPTDAGIPSCTASDPIRWAGTWSAARSFKPNDLVLSGGSAWLQAERPRRGGGRGGGGAGPHDGPGAGRGGGRVVPPGVDRGRPGGAAGAAGRARAAGRPRPAGRPGAEGRARARRPARP